MPINIKKSFTSEAKCRLKPGRAKIPKPPSTFVRTDPRPYIWVTGPDPQKHDMYIAWGRSRAQAHFRGEEWHLTFDEYYTMWLPEWHNRGRQPEDVCMTRKIDAGAWELNNVEIITRREHLQRQGFSRKGRPRNESFSYVKLRVQK